MAVDLAYLARVYTNDEPYPVSREKIREFADAVGETDTACLDVAAAQRAGHPDLLAPATFPLLLTLHNEVRALLDPGLGMAAEGVVHRDQMIRTTRPIHAGDRLDVTSTITELDTVGDTDVITFASEIRDLAGQLMCTTTSTLIAVAVDQPVGAQR
ncbi:FAS1-like dehydratase domain-containing protein [Actinoalloteichus hymeniacidonis]|uniref:Acyl dehydratase n=1 Tax=Actinoalloteichus hymeniacidonis TaxID=340345 RepID=A0AAC9HTW1_9PSEU|nr:MaoC family dehydratase N-terminal domain-containing protein [Actinoalloteichus hymeniacidonis]AOS65607.1 acyl dehydratase [Actinoalloteichus hymeniacidonis]MBB5906303.1 acyl dehydratase [Actinoalloteichus hymeniacidonis]